MAIQTDSPCLDADIADFDFQIDTILKEKEHIYEQEPSLDRETADSYGLEDYEYVRVESTYSRGGVGSVDGITKNHHSAELGADYEGYYIHAYNTRRDAPQTKIVKISKAEAEKIFNAWVEQYPSGALSAEMHRGSHLLNILAKWHLLVATKMSLKRSLELKQLLEDDKNASPSIWGERCSCSAKC